MKRPRTKEIQFGGGKANALSSDALSQLCDQIEKASKDDFAFIVLTSSSNGPKSQNPTEPIFCAGADLVEFKAATQLEDFERLFSGFARLLDTLRRAPQIVIARVHGKVVGGGVGIVAASDYVVAVNSASVRLSELAIGIGPYVIGPAIERKIGVGRFSELSLSTEFKSAEWATLSGLYQVLVSNETELDFEIDRFIERLTKTPTESLFDWKRSLWSGVDNWLELLQARARKVSAIAHRARN